MEKNKKEIRREALRRRDGLTAGQRRDYSARIAESLTGLSCYREADAVLAYISFRSEADTFLLLERAFADEKAGHFRARRRAKLWEMEGRPSWSMQCFALYARRGL